jgi:predicted nucleic acid-binding protein
VGDTGPLVAALDKRDRAHVLSRRLLSEIGRGLILPATVLAEADFLLRRRVSGLAARALLRGAVAGEHSVHFLSASLLRRAAEIDSYFADLDLGLTDSSVMALAERENLPILTYDFEHFRATRPRDGYWRLVVSERQYAESTG